MEHILPLAARYDMLPGGGPILCALSGGGDSVALCHFLKTHGYPVQAAHFNHRLRPSAAEDAALARRFCEAWDIPFHYGEGDVAALGGNTEAAARQLRYAFLEETAEAVGALRIVTAHTANDNLETVLLHLTRGCGLKGLTGIRPCRGKVVRPMLHTTRRAVEEYLKEQGLAYATDETNFDTRYARNRIRQQVVPVLESLNPRVVEAAARMTDAVRADEDYLAGLAAEAADSGEELSGLPWPLFYRAAPLLEPAPVLPPLIPVELRPGDRAATPLWTLETEETAAAPEGEPRAEEFYLSLARLRGPLVLRSRAEGDRLHPPFRTGKTVKKWHNELGVPPGEREAWPVLTCAGQIVAGAGIGPQGDFLAQPGEPALRVRWERSGQYTEKRDAE